MENLTVLKKLLKEAVFEGGQTDKELAYMIYKAVKTKVLPLGSELPSYKDLAAELGLNEKVLQSTWNILKNTYKIIETIRGVGTTIVSVLPKEGSDILKIEIPVAIDNSAVLDSGVVTESGQGSFWLTRQLWQAVHSFAHLPTPHSPATQLGWLIPGLAEIVNKSTGSQFFEGELNMIQGREQMLQVMFRTFVKPDHVCVLPAGIETIVMDSAIDVNRKAHLLISENEGLELNQLEAICKAERVGLVYLNNAALYPSGGQSLQSIIHRLLALQAKYQFRILLEDTCPKLKKGELLSKYFPRSKNFMIYIRPLSMYHPELHKIQLIATSKRNILTLERNTELLGWLLISGIAYGLAKVMATGSLVKAELDAEQIMLSAKKKAMQTLLDSGLWRADYINASTGNYFYLEPVNGQLAYDTYDQLKEHKVYVVNPAEYFNPKKYISGIIIGIGWYLNNARIIKDIEKFNSLAAPLIGPATPRADGLMPEYDI